MSIPTMNYFQDLGPQAQMMSKNCTNERIAMTLQYVALCSMIIMTGVAASQVLREAFGPTDNNRGRGRSR